MKTREEQGKKKVLEFVQKVRLEELIINMVCWNVESQLKMPEHESIKHFFTYQEVYYENYIDQLKELFIKQLDLLFNVIKEDITANFVNH